MADPTPADRLALALCRAIAREFGGDTSPCPAPCAECRQQSAAVAAELAAILRERHGAPRKWLTGSMEWAAMADHLPTDRPPLWRAMRRAESSAATDLISSDARLIRAVRDWLVPEEPPPHRGMRPGGTNLTYQETLSVERQRLRAILTAEIDRAQQGEGGNG